MTTALSPHSGAETATAGPRPADAFVAFGITGDLAKVMTFRSFVAAAGIEPPSGRATASIKDALYALFRAVPDADPAHYVRGQHEGYREIDGVAGDSTTETYAAVRLEKHADAGEPQQIPLDVEFAQEAGEGATPHEVLLHAAMTGDSKRFTRQDTIEETWRIMQPLIDTPPPVRPYAPGSWGPAEADRLVAGHGGWHHPRVAS